MWEWLGIMQISEDEVCKLIDEGFDVQNLVEELLPTPDLLWEAGLRNDSDIFRILVKVEID